MKRVTLFQGVDLLAHHDFDFDAQALCDAITSDMRVVEVPIPTRYTKESSSIAIGPSLRYVGRSVTTAAAESPVAISVAVAVTSI